MVMKRPVSNWPTGPDHVTTTTIPAWVGDIFLASKPLIFSPVTNMHPRTCSLLFSHTSRQFTYGRYVRNLEEETEPCALTLS